MDGRIDWDAAAWPAANDAGSARLRSGGGQEPAVTVSFPPGTPQIVEGTGADQP